MPKKKKGKGSKLARMSDEERVRYLQHRAELELEAKRRKQQLIAAFTKSKLKREEAFARLNTAKINEQWRFILRRIKCKELHEDVEYLWNNFNRLMKTKNLMIQRLHSELEAADVNHRRLQEAHIKIMDLIIGRCKQKCIDLHESFAHERNRIVSDETNELNRIRNNLEQYCSQLQNINFGQDKSIENILTQTKIQNAVNIYGIAYLSIFVIHMTNVNNSLDRKYFELQRISEKGLTVLSLLRMCSNLEPFSLTIQKYTLRDTGSRRAFTSCMSEPFDKLDKFWEQFNYIKSDNIFMKKECDKMSFENKQLRNTLRTYLLTISKATIARPLTSISV
ncbi:DRC2 protein, partial [Acromyrmex heyeri]